ncbi:sugar ABC transporter substrate-binding protein [Herpetosiphon geysericola]|uniref:ABC transporter substrate-binding protein n=1 Tax=Herpetosiphon geysericola TaxID=70996 RepID=A0A0P6Y456_9CHLR|nr:sugar ABC transporter substrate-binding protein [Herpetosiphon geysericola]KPL86700.1 ABC transporter substrate-binding protein [Herpetosiphon geysericola]
MRRRFVLLVLMVVVVGCGGAQAPKAKIIALLLPEQTTKRYETVDRPWFEREMKLLCDDCQVLYYNAQNDPMLQQQQAEQAIKAGARVLVLDPVDSVDSRTIADHAADQSIPVVAYDRLILNSPGVTAYISFDNQKIGELQAESLVAGLTSRGITNPKILLLHGALNDNNASEYKLGAKKVFDPLVAAGKLTIVGEFDTPDWQPTEAQQYIERMLAAGDQIDGIYAANDGTAGGALAAVQAAKLEPLPLITGQDAELTAVQRIITGEQHMTIYKALRPQAETAAKIAHALLVGQLIPTNLVNNRTVANGIIDVPAILLNPVVVTKASIKDTIINDNFWSPQQLCPVKLVPACEAAGIKP